MLNPPLPGPTPASGPWPEELEHAFQTKGPGYEPRTHHKTPDGRPKYINRLILETSPYLLQHAHNPVNWYAWSDVAFERAAREDKLVLLSVGYSTCHWCHVMELESFEDEEIAAFLNEHFIAIKVDREERPDIDDVYMAAVNAMTGSGGWPMTVVMTAARAPIFGGTYFPPRDGARGARAGFLTILHQLTAMQQNNRATLTATAADLSQSLQSATASTPPGDLPDARALHEAATSLLQQFDPAWGGFGGAPKFPRPASLEFLARYHHRTGNAGALQAIETTLENMAAGGIYDHIGGGFHRYATDRKWLVPHFEKMLYDNAQLVVVYLEGYQLTGRRDFLSVAQDTLDYVAREMTDPLGGFYSATDADSPAPGGHQEEGLYFTWTPTELREALDADDTRVVEAYYGVTPHGNFEGRSILHASRPVAEVARDLGVGGDALTSQLAQARSRLLQARARRKPPLLDDKIIVSWNALMSSAFARAAWVTGEAHYAAVAERAATFLLTHLRASDATLHRTWRSGKAAGRGFLDDYAFLVQALLDISEVRPESHWIADALALQHAQEQLFAAGDGGYYFSSDQHETLMIRDKPAYDGALPSGNSVALLNLLRLEQLTGDASFRETAQRALRVFSKFVAGHGRGAAVPKMLAALDYYFDRPLQLVVVKPPHPDAAALAALLQPLRTSFVPNHTANVVTEGDELAALARIVPLVAEKKARDARTTAYVCRGQICERPTHDPATLQEQIRRVEPLL